MATHREEQILTDDRATHHALHGDVKVQLAPISGPDTRRQLPKALFQRRPTRFLAKFGVAMGLIAAGYGVIALRVGWLPTGVSVVIIGLMYAHLVELQHECLHGHALRSKRLNRLCGVLAGVFMLSSYSLYRYLHLWHHVYLGTPHNKEFFNYRCRNLDSVGGFLYAAFHPGRYADVLRNIGKSCMGQMIEGVTKSEEATKIRTEYQCYALCVLAAIVYTAITGNMFFVLAWLLPTVLVAEPVHFGIELPEHYGLNTQTDANVLTNTRTITASRFAQWLTNYNNLHTAHHYHQGVPMTQVPQLHEMTKAQFAVVEPSYWSFYRKVLRGALRHDPAGSCMTR